LYNASVHNKQCYSQELETAIDPPEFTPRRVSVLEKNMALCHSGFFAKDHLNRGLSPNKTY
jgi:hypothetical protein